MAPARGVGPGGSHVGGETAHGNIAEGVAADVRQAPGASAGQRSVEEARHTQIGGQPAGEVVAPRHGGREVAGRRATGPVGDEGHDVEHAQAGVGAGVGAQVEAGHGGGGEGAGGAGHVVGPAGQGQDGPVVVGVPVQIEQGGPGGGAQVGQGGLVTAFADVDHALEELGGGGHGASVARPGRAGTRGN